MKIKLALWIVIKHLIFYIRIKNQLPKMLKLAGLGYFYFTRIRPEFGSFWWKGPDNTKILSYTNTLCNGKITDELKDEFKKITPK